MGGHQSGDVASQMVVSSIAALGRQACLEERVQMLRQCLLGVHQQLGELAASHGRSGVIGSTVVALAIQDQRAVCMWAGDSRCYLWRHQRLYQLSRDHTLLQRLIDEQQMSLQQAMRHPQAQALTHAVGARDKLHLDVVELNIQQNDVFLLCSDGLHQAVDHGALGHALNMTSPCAALSAMFDTALSGAAIDNQTAVVVYT